MAQTTVLKVNISCKKCKKKLMKAVSTLEGVDKIEVDEAKGTLKVTGNADPYEIIFRTRKAYKCAEVVSVGAPPAPPKQDGGQKKSDTQKHHCLDPYNCPHCRQIYVMPMPVACYDQPSPLCSIM